MISNQSISLSWCQAPICDSWSDLYSYCCQTVQVRWYGLPSLTRRRVCRFQLLLVLDRAVILGSESLGTHYHILLSGIQDSHLPRGSGPHIYIPQGQGSSVIPPVTELPFFPLLRPGGLRWMYGLRFLRYNLHTEQKENTLSCCCDIAQSRSHRGVPQRKQVLQFFYCFLNNCCYADVAFRDRLLRRGYCAVT
jgi:hypothetical protein